MKSFIELAQFYSTYHQNEMTRYTHMAGVPIVILSLMIFLGFLKIVLPGVFETNLACLITLALLIYYYRLNWQLSLVLTPILLFLLWLASWFNYAGPTTFGVWAFIITFIAGWGIQLYGHYIEGKKPALMDNLWLALVAPLYLTAELLFMAGFMKSLKEQIDGPEDVEVEIVEKKITKKKK